MDIKETGSYYTPNKLAQEMVEFILKRHEGKELLEPSAGDGSFFCNQMLKNFNVDSIELIEEKARYIKETYNVNSIHIDFLKYCFQSKKKYDIVIGNPPYVNKKLLSEKQVNMSRKLYNEFNLVSNTFNNLWAAFILGAIKLLKDTGAIFFILPFEFLQVDYSIAIRNLLEIKFNNIEIFVFKDKVFKDIQQQVCLVHLSNSEIKPYIEYKVVKGFDLEKPISSNKIFKNKPLDKWTNSIVSDEEIELLKRLSSRCLSVSELGHMSPGVVTGANDYFILENNVVKSKRIKRYVEPIISKSSHLRNVFILDEDIFANVSNKYSKVNLMKLNSFKYSKLPKTIKTYIKEGEDKEINSRFKCKQREPWYRLPKDIIGDIVFFKRYDEIPRVIVNKVKCHTTDIGYNIKLNYCYDEESVAFCFYNSLTLCLCEYHGRFYGGGVAELTPNELRKVCIPYKKIHHSQIKKLNKMIKDSIDIKTIVNYVDKIVFNNIAEENDIIVLNNIRERYLKRRKDIGE